jgi:hypothetical protein
MIKKLADLDEKALVALIKQTDESRGLEPVRRCDQHYCCGDERTRTADPLLAKHALREALTCGFADDAGQP